MQIASTKQGDRTIITLTGRLDIAAAPALDQLCRGLVEEGQHQLVLDLSGLEYLGSAGLRSILAMGHALNACSGKVMLVGAKGIVKEVLVMSGFSSMFPIFETLADAK